MTHIVFVFVIKVEENTLKIQIDLNKFKLFFSMQFKAKKHLDFVWRHIQRLTFLREFNVNKYYLLK